jgi:integrase
MNVFKRSAGSKIYWYEFRYEGRRIRASSKQGDREAAENIASAHRTRLAEGNWNLKKKKKVTVGELLDKVQKEYEANRTFCAQKRSLLVRARADFGTKMAHELTEDDLTAYVERRLFEGAAPATVNRLTEVLRKAYRLGKLPVPEMMRPEELNVREEFFTRGEFDAVHSRLPEDLRDFCLFGFLTGMRLGEIRSLAWSSYAENVLTLRGVNAKTKKSRKIVIAGELIGLMARRQAARAVTKSDGTREMTTTIFHRDGLPVAEFRKSWSSACLAAGLGKMMCPKCESESTARRCSHCKVPTSYSGRNFHDLRRTAIRNLVRAGVPETVCMAISGHRTRAVFDRYNITDEKDLAEAMRKLESYKPAENVVAMSQ